MLALPKLPLGTIARILITILFLVIVGVLALSACTNFGDRLGLRTASKGIPTVAAAGAIAAVELPTAPPPGAVAGAALPAAIPAPAATVPPVAVVPTVQPVIINDAGEVVVNVGGAQPPRKTVAQQPDSGISPAPEQPIQPAQPIQPIPDNIACGERVTYVTVRGDNVFRIAQTYHTSVYSIARLNHLPNSRQISAGRKLIIVTCDMRGAYGSGSSGGGRRYVVQPGDNMFRIGLRYGVSAEQIRVANGLPSFLISPGQVLAIP